MAFEPSRKWGAIEIADDAGIQVTEKHLVIVLAMIRLVKSNSDVVVTYNLPVSESKDIQEVQSLITSNTDFTGKADISISKRIIEAKDRIEASLKNFEIFDWNLFG